MTVNGEVAQLGCSIEPGRDTVMLDSRPILQDDKTYIVLNKPAGTITTASDTHGRRTVMDCVAGVKTRVFPVGRLDLDVEGVLLMTNDGELAHRLIHPSYEVERVYIAWLRGRMRPETARRLEKGILLEDGMTAPAKAAILHAGDNGSEVRLTLHEGRKREVKRMCAAAGHPVRRLIRVDYGGITADGLRPGEWRYLNPDEAAALRRMVRL